MSNNKSSWKRTKRKPESLLNKLKLNLKTLDNKLNLPSKRSRTWSNKSSTKKLNSKEKSWEGQRLKKSTKLRLRGLDRTRSVSFTGSWRSPNKRISSSIKTLTSTSSTTYWSVSTKKIENLLILKKINHKTCKDKFTKTTRDSSMITLKKLDSMLDTTMKSMISWLQRAQKVLSLQLWLLKLEDKVKHGRLQLLLNSLDWFSQDQDHQRREEKISASSTKFMKTGLELSSIRTMTMMKVFLMNQ